MEVKPKKKGFRGLIDRLRRAVLRFAHNTNWHGFGPAVQSIGVARVVWSVIFVGCAAVCMWQLSLAITKYLSNPTSTSYTLNYGSLDFPAVTICNLNAYKKSQLNNILSLNALLTYFGTMSGSNTTSSGRKKRSIDEWPGPLQFSDFVDSDTVVGGITFEEFLITVMDYYIHNKWEMEANRKRQLDFFHAISRDPQTTQPPSIQPLGVNDKSQQHDNNNNGHQGDTTEPTTILPVTQNDLGVQTESATETSTVGFMAGLVETVTRWIDIPRIRSKRASGDCPNLPANSLYASVVYTNSANKWSNVSVTCVAGTVLGPQGGTPQCSSPLSAWGTWSFKPVCIGLCTAFTVSSPVVVSYSNSAPLYNGTVATFSCISSAYGMTPSTAVSTCTFDGTWSSSTVPTCVLFCSTMAIGGSNPATIVYSPTSTPYYVATTATATCATDYTLTGATNPFTCTSMGTFAIWQPNSTVSYCAAPCSNINSTVGTSAVTYSDGTSPRSSGSTVTVTCASGYQLGSNGGTATCANGNWTTMPVCLLVCSTLTISGSNAATIVYSPATTPYYPTTTATVTCATDYILTGATNPFTCTSMGTFAIWSPNSTVAYCAAPCANINSTVGTSSVSYTDATSPYSSGSTVTVTCASGYQLGTNGGTATCANGNWTTMPVCIPVCSTLTIGGSNAATVVYSPSATPYYPATTATVTCASNYILTGATSPFTCTSMGTFAIWSPNSTIAYCAAPCTNINSTVGTSSVTYSDASSPYSSGSTVTVTCASGYQLGTNGGSATCTNGNWTTTPVCLATCAALTVVGPPLAVSYSMASPYFVGTIANFSCVSPFILVPSGTTFTCGSAGSWSSSTQPTCQMACDVLSIGSSAVSYTATYSNSPVSTPGNTAYINCTTGYVLYGPSSFTCVDYTTYVAWSPNDTNTWCAAPCVNMTFDATTQSTATIVYSQTPHVDSSRVTVTCASNYVMSGTTPAVCTNGSWNQPAPICLAPCSPLTVLNSLSIVYSDSASMKRYNSTATVTCAAGYVMRGNDTVTCLNAVWTTQTFPGCYASCSSVTINLGNPTQYRLGGVIQANPDFIVNTTAVLSCNSPLQLVDPTSMTTYSNMNLSLTCLSNGTWDKVIPECLAVCPNFAINNANVTFPNSLNQDGDVAVAECKNDYLLYGPSQFTCYANATDISWIPTYSSSYCAAPCVDMTLNSQTTAHSVATYTETTTIATVAYHRDSSTVTVHCAADYTLSGITPALCTNGSWNELAPLCIAPCSSLTILNSDTITYSDTNTLKLHNSTATVACLNGYVMRGNSTLTCYDGVWTTQTFPGCYVSCPAITITNGNPTSYLINGVYQSNPDEIVNTTAVVSCPSPYSLVNPTTLNDYANANTNLTCLINGTWDNIIPECRYVCTKFAIANANISYPNPTVMHGDTANIVCINNHVLYGPSTYTCNAAMGAGIWDQNYNSSYCAPACIDMTMDAQTISQSTVTYSETTVANLTNLHKDLSTISVICATNYVLIGQSPILCHNGTWQYSAPVCYAPCSTLSVLNSDPIVYSDPAMIHNSTATITCSSGFVMRGNTTLTCNNGVWSAQSWPSCYATCGPVTLTNGVVIYRLSGIVQALSDEIVNTTATLTCNSPYKLVNNVTSVLYSSRTVTCLANGTWNYSIPICISGLCTIFSIANANVTTQTTAIYNGDVAAVTCLNDYSLYGPSQYTCITNETGTDWYPNYTDTFCAVPCVDIATNLQTFNNSQIVYTQTTSVSGVAKHRDLSTVTITCSPTYFFIGQSPTLTCWNGTWNYPVPSCLKNCNYTPNAAVANSQMSSYSDPTYYSHNSTATLSCVTSPSYYLLLGAPQSGPHYQCNDGTWQLIGGSPVCMAPCTSFSLNNSVLMTYSSPATLQHNSTVTVTCASGYSLIGDNPVTCDNGTWSTADFPACLPKCSDITVANAYGTLYKLVITWKVGSGGSAVWYTNTTNLTATAIVSGSTATVSCLPGYTMIDPIARTIYSSSVKNLTCLTTFAWSAEIPACTMLCNNFTVANAIVTFTSAAVSTSTPKLITTDNATIVCKNNYNLYGPSTVTCNNGSWVSDPTLAYCAPTCPNIVLDAQTLANSVVSYTQTTNISSVATHRDSSQVSVVCSPAYTFSGQSAVMTCQNGSWSSSPPVCLKNCNSTPNVNVMNSVIPPTYTDPIYFRHNSTATMWCNSTPVYTLSGVSAVGPHYVCLNGVWNQTGGTPVCLAPCTAINIGNMNLVTYSNPNFIHNSTAVVVCNSTYVMRGNATLTCINGVWTTQMFPSCFAACNPINITNGQVEYQFLSQNLTTTDYMENTTALLSCDVNYTMTGSPASMVGPTMINTCQKDHTWNYTIPRCLPACTNVTTINMAILRYDDPNYFVMGTSVNISCPAGWVLTGPTVMTCGSVTPGVWQPNGTFCHQPCATIAPTVPMGITTYSDTVTGGSLYVWNSTVAITCPTNYILTGPTLFTCVDTAVWFSTESGKFNSTNITRCHAPCDPTLTGAGSNISIVFSDPNYIHMSNATFSCPPFFLLYGDTAQQCLDGNWTGNVAPTCLAPCASIDIGNSNLVNYTSPNFIHNSSAVVVCNSTYVMRGNATLTCINGVWTTQMFPSCFAACSPINITNGQVEYQFLGQNLTTTDYMENTTALLSCNNGYAMTGSPASMVGPTMINTCQKDHSWNYSIPQCLPACTNITTINMAILRYDDPNYFVMGTSVNISCPAGWVLTGPTVMTCGGVTPGVWQPNGTFCHQPCATIAPAVPMGITTYSDTVTGGSLYVWNSTVAITCPTNYILTGPTFFTCVDTAVWYSTESGKYNSTNITRCHAPCDPTLTGAGLNVSIVFSDPNYIHMSNGTFSCPPFFVLNGDGSQQCINGNWTGNVAPTCLKSCPPISLAYTTVILNGNATVSTTPIPTYTQINLTCPTDFMLTNVASGTVGFGGFSCHDGQFVAPDGVTVITTLPVCTAMCPNWTLPNGNVTFMSPNRLDTTTVWFQCANNYALDDPSCAPSCASIRPSYSNCTNGTWSSWPACFKSCPAISVLQPTINVFNYSHVNHIVMSTVNFYCLNDSAGHTYVLNTIGTLTCRSDGTWDNPIPVCIIQCPPINLIGTVAVSILYSPAGPTLDRTPTTVATYSCPSGYIVFNFVKSTCQNDSTWSPAPTADGKFPYCLQMPAAVQTILNQMGNVTGAALATAQASAISYLIATLTSDELANISYPMNELIVGCLMNEQVCLSSDWERDLDPSLGACYRYNNVKPSKFKIVKPGRNFGLQLLLNTQQNEYLGTTQNAGFLVIIHEPGATVFADASGYKVPPGYDTNLQMTYSGTTHQPSPYGTCIKDKTGASVFYYPHDYSVEGCLRSCLQFITIKTCGCADIKSPMPSSATICDVSKSECIATVAATTTSEQLSSSCTCPPPCSDPTYFVTVSQSVWPTRVDPVLNNFPLCYNLTNVTFHQHYNIGVTDTQFENCYESFRENYGRLNVYFNTLNQELLITSPSYSIWNLLTDVGSSLGLFLGGSFITIGELIHFCLLAVLAICVNPPDYKKAEENEEENEADPDELTPAQVAELTAIMVALKQAQIDNEIDEDSDEEEIEEEEVDEEVGIKPEEKKEILP